MSLDQLLDRYDRGRLSRRELLTALALVGFVSEAAQGQQTPAVPSSTLNHLELRVKNLQESTDFYGRLFGAKKLREDRPDYWHLAMAGSSISLLTAPEKTGIDHFGVGVPRFDAEAIEAAVKRALPSGDTQIVPSRTAVQLHDPNGILVQISSK